MSNEEAENCLPFPAMKHMSGSLIQYLNPAYHLLEPIGDLNKNDYQICIKYNICNAQIDVLFKRLNN